MSEPRPHGTPVQPWVRWSVARTDHHAWITWLAMLGAGIAAAMALFGLPPVDLHGLLHQFGIMDPLCGGTRAARYTARGELALAWTYNPLGIITVLGAAAIAVRAFVGLMFSSWLTANLVWTPRRKRLLYTIGVIALIALQIRQQLRADLLMAGT